MNALLWIAVALGVAAAAPAGLLDSNDSAVVGSEVKEQIRPFEDLHEAGTQHSDNHGGSAEKEFEVDDDEKGYYKSKSGKGNKGYKHFDSFHKKNGDKYGYEKHSSHGKKHGDGDGGSHYTSSSYSSDDGDKGDYHDGAGSEKNAKLQKKNSKDHKPAATDYSYSHYESDGDGDSGHYEGDDGGHYEGDSGHYEGDHGNYEGDGDSGHYEEGDSGAYHEGSSGAYHDGDSGNYDSGASSRASTYHGGSPGATSYYIRHY